MMVKTNVLSEAWGALREEAGRKFREFIRDEEGATLVEYALLLGLIAIVTIAALTFLGGAIRDRFQDAGTKIGQP